MHGASGDAQLRPEVSGACRGLSFVLEALWRSGFARYLPEPPLSGSLILFVSRAAQRSGQPQKRQPQYVIGKMIFGRGCYLTPPRATPRACTAV
jgi:hypothetical protein